MRADSIASSDADQLSDALAPSPYASWVIIPDSIDRAPLTSMSDLLQARVPGLSVQRISGASGSASRIRLRGTRSSTSSNMPLVIIDGLRIEAEQPPFFVVPGSSLDLDIEWASRLDDLDPEDVERVELLSGPASAARFGRGASAGAILITTRRATRSGLRWRTHGTLGTVSQTTDFPASYDQRGVAVSDLEHIDYCGMVAQSRRLCYPIPDSLLTSNALERHSPFSTGARSQLGISGGAGNEEASLYLAGDFTRENGTLDLNDLHRDHLLVNGRLRPLSSLEIGARAGYTRGSLSGIAPGSDWSVLRSGLGGGPDVDQGYLTSPDTLARLAAQRSSARFIAGGTLSWKPIRWLQLTGALGADHSSWISDNDLPVWTVGASGHARTNFSSEVTTARAAATTSWLIGDALHVGATIGIEQVKNRDEGRSIRGVSLGGLYDSTFNRYWMHDRLNSTYGQIDLAWRNRVALAGSLRSDRIRRSYLPFGNSSATHPSVGVAWQLSNEPWYPRNGAIRAIRLRAAYGESGPPRISSGQFAGPEDRTPVARETEAGLDLEGLDGRVTLALTYYRGKSNDLAIDPWSSDWPFEGVTQGINQTVRNHGVEAALSATIFDARAIGVFLDATAAFPRTRYEGLNIILGALEFGPQRQVTGYPVAGYWAPPILSYNDLNEDGMIGTADCTERQFPSSPECEVQLGAITYLGSPVPTREFSLRPRVTHRRMTLSALFDYRGGHKLFNRTAYFRCRYFAVCRESQDASASLEDQALVAAGALGSAAGYIEDASYWKFRELSLSMPAPARWAAVVGARELKITLAARNLATWTGYRGPDPEVNVEGYESLLSTDSFSQPAVRYLMMRLDVGW